MSSTLSPDVLPEPSHHVSKQANPTSSSADCREHQRRNEALVTQIEKMRENHMKRREAIYTMRCRELEKTRHALTTNPPTEMTLLLNLHRESLKREEELTAVRVYHDHAIRTARTAYEAEVQSIEEGFSNARTQAKNILLQCLERRKNKLKNEKHMVDLNEEAVVGHPHRTTRGLRNRSTSNCSAILLDSSHKNLEESCGNHQDYISTERDVTSSNLGLPTSASFITGDDAFSMVTSNVDPHIRQSPIFQQLVQLGTSAPSRTGAAGASGLGRRALNGLPGSIPPTSITPGSWNNFHKSQFGICAAKADDTQADLEHIQSLVGLLCQPKTSLDKTAIKAHDHSSTTLNPPKKRKK